MNAESHSDRCGVFLVCSDRLASSDLFELVRNSVPVGSIWHCNVTMTAVVVHVAFTCELAILCLALSQVLTALLCSFTHNWETAVWLMIKVTKFHTQLTTTLMCWCYSLIQCWRCKWDLRSRPTLRPTTSVISCSELCN